MKRMFPFVLSALVLLATLPAFAQFGLGPDNHGVVPIDRSTAYRGLHGCANDGASSITICRPGSYRLMSNLTLGSETLNGIDITADNVTLDLNGFTLTANSNTKRAAILATTNNVVVRNGQIVGNTLDLSGTGEVASHVNVTQFGLNIGIWIGQGTVTHCQIVEDAGSNGTGIYAISRGSSALTVQISDSVVAGAQFGLWSRNDLLSVRGVTISGAQVAIGGPNTHAIIENSTFTGNQYSVGGEVPPVGTTNTSFCSDSTGSHIC